MLWHISVTGRDDVPATEVSAKISLTCDVAQSFTIYMPLLVSRLSRTPPDYLTDVLAAYNEVHAHKVMDLLREANVSISSNPHISLVVQGRYDQEPIRRGITRVKQLWQHGVNVFASQDDVADPFYPFGRNDQQEVAAYLCHTAHMAAPSEIEAAFDFVTSHAAQALRLPDYGLEPGCTADLNVLAAPTVREVLRLQQPPPWVIRQGKVPAHNQLRREFLYQ